MTQIYTTGTLFSPSVLFPSAVEPAWARSSSRSFGGHVRTWRQKPTTAAGIRIRLLVDFCFLMQGSMSAPMEVPRPGQVPPLLSMDMTHAPVAVTPGWPPHLADGNQLLNLDTGTAPGPPLIGSPGSAVSNSPSDSPTEMGSPTRRRGRPRKGEEMTEEERKARRKEINRLAARRAHQKKLDILSKLESVRLSPTALTGVCIQHPVVPCDSDWLHPPLAPALLSDADVLPTAGEHRLEVAATHHQRHDPPV